MAAARTYKRNPTAQAENHKNRRAFIVAEAAKLFAKYGYEATTMDQVSAATKLNKGTIYYYYKSKSDILFDMQDSIVETAIRNTQPALKMEHADDALNHLIDVIVRWIAEHRNEVRSYFQESVYFPEIFSPEQFEKIRAQQKTITQSFYAILDKGIASGEFPKMDTTFVGRSVIGMIMWVYRWPEDEFDVEQAIASMQNLVTNGLGASSKN